MVHLTPRNDPASVHHHWQTTISTPARVPQRHHLSRLSLCLCLDKCAASCSAYFFTPSATAAASRGGPTESARTNLIFVLRTSPPFSVLTPPLDSSATVLSFVFPRISTPISLSYILTRLLCVRIIVLLSIPHSTFPGHTELCLCTYLKSLVCGIEGQAKKRFRALANPPLLPPDIV
ncbi:hypothetical protein BJV78DRAFT_210930 [Lactifluus subvellereus]|nr:hypothetical protein BJV78DRAFT_210930 [Lactifluus subvellereus]